MKREVYQLLEDVRALARMAEEEKRHYCGLRGGGERRLMLPHPSTFHCEEKASSHVDGTAAQSRLKRIER